jgi:hypothetical protein
MSVFTTPSIGAIGFDHGPELSFFSCTGGTGDARNSPRVVLVHFAQWPVLF